MSYSQHTAYIIWRGLFKKRRHVILCHSWVASTVLKLYSHNQHPSTGYHWLQVPLVQSFFTLSRFFALNHGRFQYAHLWKIESTHISLNCLAEVGLKTDFFLGCCRTTWPELQLFYICYFALPAFMCHLQPASAKYVGLSSILDNSKPHGIA